MTRTAPAIGAGPDAAAMTVPERVSNKIILMLLVVLVTLAAAGAGGILMLKPATAHPGKPPARVDGAVATYAAMPVMSFTLNDGSRLRELRVRAVLELDPAVPLESVRPFIPGIADAMTVRMLEVDPDELRGQDGPLYIKTALRYAADKAMRPLKVRQVLVQDMLLR